MSDDLIRKRSRRVLRLGLLVLFILLAVAIALLFPWSREEIGVEAAEGLLQHFKERGDAYTHIVSILGKPRAHLSTPKEEGTPQEDVLICFWEFPREGLFEIEVTNIWVKFEHGKISSIAKDKRVTSGSALWQYRWDRLKDRLALGK